MMSEKSTFYLPPETRSVLQHMLDWDIVATGRLQSSVFVRYAALPPEQQQVLAELTGYEKLELAEDVELPCVRVILAPHQFEDAWNSYEDGEPGKCAFPLCNQQADAAIHLPAEKHDFEEHPQKAGSCLICGLSESQCSEVCGSSELPSSQLDDLDDSTSY